MELKSIRDITYPAQVGQYSRLVYFTDILVTFPPREVSIVGKEE